MGPHPPLAPLRARSIAAARQARVSDPRQHARIDSAITKTLDLVHAHRPHDPVELLVVCGLAPDETRPVLVMPDQLRSLTGHDPALKADVVIAVEIARSVRWVGPADHAVTVTAPRERSFERISEPSSWTRCPAPSSGCYPRAYAGRSKSSVAMRSRSAAIRARQRRRSRAGGVSAVSI